MKKKKQCFLRPKTEICWDVRYAQQKKPYVDQNY